MNSYNTVIVCFRFPFQLIYIRHDELWPSLSENTENLRCFHPYSVIRIVQELLKYQHIILINVGIVCGNIF